MRERELGENITRRCPAARSNLPQIVTPPPIPGKGMTTEKKKKLNREAKQMSLDNTALLTKMPP